MNTWHCINDEWANEMALLEEAREQNKWYRKSSLIKGLKKLFKL